MAVGKSYNQLPDDVSVSGSFTGTKEMNFFVEIDGVGTPNTFRWSRDGGATFIDERVEINASTQSIAHGLDITFTSTTGHGLGDCWTFVAQPTHVMVTILNPGSTSQVDRTFARNALGEAMEEQRELGNLSIRTSTEATADQLYLFHSMDRLIENNVSVSGTSLASNLPTAGNLWLTEDSDNLIRREHSFGLTNYPFGVTWRPGAPGNYHVYAIARDKESNNSVLSSHILITATTSTGELPVVEMAKLVPVRNYVGVAETISLSSTASDADGHVQQVAFYVNGALVGVDASSPYEASYDINASGLYEVYAVASDDDGNDITSTVQRIKVNELEDKDDILIVGSVASTSLGSVAQLTATFKSPGAIGYNNAVAHVYVDGVYMGIADKLPYTAPGIGQEDPGQIFSFALLGNSLGEREIEFVIFNDDETASAKTTVSVEESVLTDNEQFLTELYQGLYGRNPESDELGQFYGRLMDGTITRADVIEELRRRQEFIKARDIVLAQKTLYGDWRKINEVVDDIDPVILAAREGINAVLPASQRPDDGDIQQTATPITMNEVLNARIEEYGDDDWFTFESLGPGLDGVLEVIIETSGEVVYDVDLFRVASNGAEEYVPGFYSIYYGGFYGLNSGEFRVTFDLRNATRPDITYFLQVEGSEFALGDYKMTVKNDIVLARLQAQEALENIGKIESLVNSYPITSTLGYLTGKYDYVDQYGALGSHNPEEFFTRLFRNKYEQDPSRVQVLALEWKR